VGETSVVKRGRKLVFKSVGRVVAAKDVTAGGCTPCSRGGGAAARDGSRILRTNLSDLVLGFADFVSSTSIYKSLASRLCSGGGEISISISNSIAWRSACGWLTGERTQATRKFVMKHGAPYRKRCELAPKRA
jgi:hypothetical protein